MFTVAALGVPGRLRQSLTNTNCIESMISITRTTTGRVKHWRDGTMKKRWIAAGMLEAERSFRRLKGHADMPTLIVAIHRATTPAAVTPTNSLKSPEQVRDHHRLQHEAGHPPVGRSHRTKSWRWASSVRIPSDPSVAGRRSPDRRDRPSAPVPRCRSRIAWNRQSMPGRTRLTARTASPRTPPPDSGAGPRKITPALATSA